MFRPAVLLAVLSFWSGGCASTTTTDAPPASPVEPSPSSSDTTAPVSRTAVLPFANESNDVAAPEIFRHLLFEAAAGRHYALQPLEETDRRLREELQITDGGQLNLAVPSELGNALEVQTLFYGDVLEWKKITTGIYNAVSVKARFKLVDAATGAVRWERTHEVRRHVEIGSSGHLGTDILAGVIANLFLNPVTPYARQLVREVGQQLPDAREGTPRGAIPQGEIR